MTTKSIKSRKPGKRKTGSRVARPRSARLDMRIDAQVKTLIERAAAITGQTLTDFAISNLVDSAMATIERHERLILTDRDRDRFLDALDRPAKPLPALTKAARRHALATQED
ncbi:MAG: DUF1778 domain-containing protein [Acidobacteriota bacterium]|nr:MAG: DUF1778 domain-containing protein [Acidobacteriota bacterium]